MKVRSCFLEKIRKKKKSICHLLNLAQGVVKVYCVAEPEVKVRKMGSGRQSGLQNKVWSNCLFLSYVNQIKRSMHLIFFSYFSTKREQVVDSHWNHLAKIVPIINHSMFS